MFVSLRFVSNTYRDSVALMQLAAKLGERPGVDHVAAVMASAGNIDLLREAGLLADSVDPRPSDILVLVKAKSKALADSISDDAIAALSVSNAPPAASSDPKLPVALRSLRQALAAAPESTLALISVPGEYAAAEAEKALDCGLNVMLFSDNVSVEDEVRLKTKAGAKRLLLMGPDCGTAIIDGVPLGFANNVRRGVIGCVGASGTGLQQVTSLIHQAGEGISQAIGAGGRDLSAAVAARTTIAAFDRLLRDADTHVIVLIGKPPAPAVARKLISKALAAAKPVVTCFVGAEPAIEHLERNDEGGRVHYAETLDAAARIAVALVRGKAPSARTGSALPPRLPKPASGQRFIRGLFSGGTFCYEAAYLLVGRKSGIERDRVWTNTPIRAEDAIADPWISESHTLIDLGDDAFTRGRPHPMIDHRLRNDRIAKEAADPSVAVILLDVVLGHGAHPDPASVMLPAIRSATLKASKAGRKLTFVGSVCGTDLDPQGLTRQSDSLRAAGVVLATSNADAVRIAVAIVKDC
jgi:FdrA protein